MGVPIRRPALKALILLLTLGGAASAHVVPLDITLMPQGQQVLARILTPDGLSVSGVRLVYRLNEGAEVAFRETGAGMYLAPLVQAAPSVRLTLLDRTFRGEESQAARQVSWPPQLQSQPTPTLRLPARPLAAPDFTFGPALIWPTVLALVLVVLVWLGLNRSRAGVRAGRE